MNILVLLESPGKIKTVSAILAGLKDGNKYTVKASMGHIAKIKDEGPYKMGVDLETFEPSYEVDPKKKDIVKELKAYVKDSDMVYLASDDDREGSAIANSWIKFLAIPKSKYKRLVFREITEKGIKEGIKNLGDIDHDLVESARARQVLDRIIGYRLSPLTLCKLGAKSAGRVQSAGLKILVDRENEISSFKSKDYYEIFLPYTKGRKQLTAQYKGTTKKKIVSLPTKEAADEIVSACPSGKFVVDSITTKDRKVSAKQPFTTSTFQQEVSAKLNYNPKKAMSIAQSLYEKSLITYMRTDAIRLSDDFILECKKIIETKYGKDYYSGFVVKGKSNENAQNAHESIRPTHLEKTPDSVKAELETDEYKVYKIIYNRAMASLMADAVITDTNVNILNGDHKFVTTGHTVKFDGYQVLYSEYEDEEEEKLPDFTKGETIKDKPLEIVKKTTSPPSRYTEATFVKQLETLGIGRPSTFASTIETLKTREYIVINKKTISVTDMGMRVSKLLDDWFASIINTTYTAEMETLLDEIANGKKKATGELKTFYETFAPLVLKAQREANKDKEKPKDAGKECPQCKKPLVIRKSRSGTEFIACSGFPRCRYTESLTQPAAPIKTDVQCPQCKGGYLVERKNKKGQIFYGCSEYSKGCKYAISEEQFQQMKLQSDDNCSDRE